MTGPTRSDRERMAADLMASVVAAEDRARAARESELATCRALATYSPAQRWTTRYGAAYDSREGWVKWADRSVAP